MVKYLMTAQRAMHWLGVILILGVSAWVSYYCFGQTFGARWMVIDDHSIALLLGPDRRFSLTEFIPALLETEVGRPGQEGRFRPAYYVMLLFEALIAGDDPGVWYGLRMLYFACMLAGTWLALYLLIGFWGGLGLTLWLSTIPIWQDIFARLGPGESYAALGLGLYLPTFAIILRRYESLSLWQRGIVQLVFISANFILVGSKENWLALLLPNLLLCAVLIKRRALDRVSICSFVIVTAYTLVVAAVLAAGLLNAGHVYASVYGSEFTGQPFFEALQSYLSSAWTALMEPAAVLVLLAAICAVLAYRNSAIRARALGAVIASACVMATLFVLFIWHKYFYAGNWLILKRYGFPGECLVVFFWAGVFSILAALVHRLRPFATAGFVVSVLCLGLGYYRSIPGAWEHLRAASSVTVSSSQTFSAYLEKVVAAAKDHPTHVVVVEVTGSGVDWEFEPAISVIRFLTFYGLGDRLFLRLHGPSDPPTVPVLRDFMLQLSQTGKLEGLPRARVRPIARLKKKKCFSVEVRRMVESSCESLGPVPL